MARGTVVLARSRALVVVGVGLLAAGLVAASAATTLADSPPNSPYGDASIQTVDLSGTWNFTPVHPAAAQTTIYVPGGGWYKQGFTTTQEAIYSRQITIPNTGVPQVTQVAFGAVNNQATMTISGPGLPAGGQVVATCQQAPSSLPAADMGPCADTASPGTFNMTAFQPSAFDLTPYVIPGDTYTINVDVIGRLGFQETTTPKYAVPDAAEWQAAIPQGIFRSAELKVYPAVYIADAQIETSVPNRTLTYDVWLINETAQSQSTTLGGALSSWNNSGWQYPAIPGQTVTLAPDSTTEVTVGPLPWLAPPASYWWPNVPYQPGYLAQLHLLTLTTTAAGESDSATYRFGFRTFTQNGTHYMLNGSIVRLRGDDLQGADYDGIVDSIIPGSSTAATGAGDAYDTLPGFLPPNFNGDGSPGWPQAVDNYQHLNYNFVRLHQEPVTPYMLDVLDQMGLMVVDETPIRGSNSGQDFTNGTVTPALGVGVSTNPFNNMVGALTSLMGRDRNHAAIMKWSLMNEVSGQNALEIALFNQAGALDPTRPVENESLSGNYYTVLVNPPGQLTFAQEPNYANFAHYLTYCGTDADGVHPSGQGEFLWPAGSTPQGFEMFGTEAECMREQDAADIRPYALESGWLSFVPGVKTTDLTLEEKRPAVFGADDLANPWSNPIIQRIQASFNPLLVADSAYWRLNDIPGPNGQWPNGRYPQTLVHGQTAQRTLTVFNDTFSAAPVTVGWQERVGSPSGTLAGSGSVTLSVPVGADVQLPITFTAPASGSSMYLVLTSTQNGQLQFQESNEVFNLAAAPAGPLVTDDNSVSNPTPTVLFAAAGAGATNIKVASVTGLSAGLQLLIDTGTNQETATIQSVGTQGRNTTLSAASSLGATNIKVASVTGLTAGDTITIDTGTSQETATIQTVGTSGAGGSGLTLTGGLSFAHSSGAAVSDPGSGVTLTGPLAMMHASGVPVQVAPANDKWSYSVTGTTSNWSSGTSQFNNGNIPGTTATGAAAGIPVATYSTSSTTGATATLKFFGTQVTLYGWVANNYGIASISLDGGTPTTFDEGPGNPNTLLFAIGSTPSTTPGTNPSQIPNGLPASVGAGGFSQAVPMYASPQLSPGEHTLVVTVTGTHDAASTGSTVAIDSAIAAEVAPSTLATITPNTVNGFYTQNPTVTLTATDAGGPGIATTYYKVDTQASYSVYLTPFTLSGDGAHTLSYYSVDTNGTAETPHTLTVTIDTTPPVTTASVSPTPSGGQVNGPATISLNATDATSGVAATYYTIDGEAPRTYGAPFTISTGGLHTVTYYSVDNAGNTEQVNTLTIQVNPQATTSPSGNVPGTLSLSIGATAPSFGAFQAGVAQTYNSTVGAIVTTTAASSSLTAADACTPAGTCFPGHLVNTGAGGGPYALTQGLQVNATSSNAAAGGGGTYTDLSVTNPATLLTYSAPVSDDAVTLGFRQPIAATDPLRTGTYTKTITFTLSTSTP